MPIIGPTYAVIQPFAMVIKITNASVALSTMLGFVANVCFANLAHVFILCINNLYSIFSYYINETYPAAFICLSLYTF